MEEVQAMGRRGVVVPTESGLDVSLWPDDALETSLLAPLEHVWRDMGDDSDQRGDPFCFSMWLLIHGVE